MPVALIRACLDSMQRIKTTLRSTFFSLLAHMGAKPEAAQPGQLEALRQAMLDLLGEQGAQEHPRVARQLRLAPDAKALWYARSDLMAALATLHGESDARQSMENLTIAFRGQLPKTLLDHKRSIRS